MQIHVTTMTFKPVNICDVFFAARPNFLSLRASGITAKRMLLILQLFCMFIFRIYFLLLFIFIFNNKTTTLIHRRSWHGPPPFF
jgi:hypothetical protein